MHTDLLIAKRINTGEDKQNLEIISMSLYGTKTELDKLLKRKSGLVAHINGSSPYKGVKFTLDRVSDYATKRVSSKYFQRVTLVKQKEMLLDQTQFQNPVIILPKEQAQFLNETVMECLRDKLVSPLFPNVNSPFILAKELFVSLEDAKTTLANVQKGIVVTEDEKLTQRMLTMYQEWCNYMTNELHKRSRLIPLEIIVSPRELLAFEIVVDEQEIRNFITEGLKKKKILIADSPDITNRYETFDTYTPAYSDIFKKRISTTSKELHQYGSIREETKYYLNSLNKKPISVQTDLIEAGLKSLNLQRKVNIIGEPGVGKTYITSTTAYLDALYSKKAAKVLVLSPDHIVESAWQKEIEETFSEVKCHHIRSIKDLIECEKSGYLDDEVHRFFILSQTTAKSGYNEGPKVCYQTKLFEASGWSKVYFDQKVLVCPDCGEVIKKRKKNDTKKTNEKKFIEVPVGLNHFSSQKYNRRCKKCKSILWGPLNKNAISYKEWLTGEKKKEKFVYTTAGFLPNDLQAIESIKEEIKHSHRSKKTNNAYLAKLRKAELELQGLAPKKRIITPYRVSVAEYIFKKHKNTFSHLILDEVHELQNSGTARTQAASKLIASIPKVITGTGSLMNGYANSLFYIFFMLFPDKMKKAGFEVDDKEKFQELFGVAEKRYILNEDGSKTKPRSISKPGISPIIFPKFLQDTSLFLSLDELVDSVTTLKSEKVGVPLSKDLIEGKKELEKVVSEVSEADVGKFKTLIPILYSYLDMPTVPKEINLPDGSIYRTKVLSNAEDLKMQKALEILKDEVRNKNNRVMIYTYYTSDGINEYIQGKLLSEGFKVVILNESNEDSVGCDGTKVKIPKNKRQFFIEEQVRLGAEVLVVNPQLISTGTNLIDFSTIIRYQMDCKVYLERQARGRIRRIGQEKACTIYYLFYEDSLQEHLTKMMFTKIIASEAIEAKMDSNGLEVFADERTPEEILCKKFFEHFKND